MTLILQLLIIAVSVTFWDNDAQRPVNEYSVNDSDGNFDVCIRILGTSAKKIVLILTAVDGSAIGKLKVALNLKFSVPSLQSFVMIFLDTSDLEESVRSGELHKNHIISRSLGKIGYFLHYSL